MKYIIVLYITFGILIGIVMETCLYYKKNKIFNYREPNFENFMYGVAFWPSDIYMHIYHIRTIYRLKKYIKQLLKNAKKLNELKAQLNEEIKVLNNCSKELKNLLDRLDKYNNTK